MGPGDVHDVLDRLLAAGLEPVLDGGWGVDALLGEQSRPHVDVDVVVLRDDLQLAEAALAASGYAGDDSASPGLPARRVLTAADGRGVDLHLVVRDEAGNGWQELDHGAWGEYAADGLNGVGVIDGRYVRCVTVQLQVRHHLGYPPREQDLSDLRALAARFGIAIPPPWRN